MKTIKKNPVKIRNPHVQPMIEIGYNIIPDKKKKNSKRRCRKKEDIKWSSGEDDVFLR
jgi:hypothetical protein